MLLGRFVPSVVCWAVTAALLLTVSACSSGSAASTPPAPETTSQAAAAAAPATAQARAHHRRKRHPAKHRRRPPRAAAGVAAVDVPNRSLTPGVALPVGARRICVPGYAASVRDVPQSEKDAVYAEYGVADVPYAHEVDHLISLELGGSNAMANLWPEPYAGRWGAGTKDRLENRLHDLVCAGALSLAYAQHIEATDWVAAYRRFVSPTPPASAAALHRTGAGSGAPGGSGTCTPGYSPCLVDHGGADYDCAGGGGNGPYFTAPGITYTVTGSDPYHLDGNHDGRACGP